MKIITITRAKQAVADDFNKESWARVMYEYEHGLGISKLISFEGLMELVIKKLIPEIELTEGI